MKTEKRIQKALKEAGIKDWSLIELKKESAELYFVKKELDQRRTVDETLYYVTVFRKEEKDGKPMTGETRITLLSSYSDEKMTEDLKDAYKAAGFVLNPGYDLPKRTAFVYEPKKGDLFDKPLAEIAGRMAKAAYKADVRRDSFINSLEIFVRRTHKHVLSSAGTDVAWDTASIEGEFVVQTKEPKDVEMFFLFDYDSLAEEALNRKVDQALMFVNDRAIAEDTLKSGKYDVLISGENAGEIISSYAFRASAQMIYSHYSDWEVGKDVQGAEKEGLTLTFRATEPYSAEGYTMEDKPLLEKGTFKTIQASSRFAQYLGIEPTGAYAKISCETKGTESFDKMRKKPVIWPVLFSSFDMDNLSGDFGGEVRLGYYFDGEKTIPVTGFSISGNLFECQKTMEATLDRFSSRSYDGPYAFLMHNVSLAGK